MKGTYVIKQDGVEIARSENLITTEGKRIIASYIAGVANDWGGAIAIGAGTLPATVSDTALRLEWDREETLTRAVTYNTPADGTHRITLKTTLPSQVAGKIYELGLFSTAYASGGASPSMALAGVYAGDDWEWLDGGDWTNITTSPDTAVYRVGSDAAVLELAGSSDSFRLNLGLSDFSMYGSLDKFTFGCYRRAGTVSAVVIKFYTDDSNYYSYTVPTASDMFGTSTNNYTVSSYTKNLFVATGSPSWASISAIGLDITGSGAECAIDIIRIDDSDEADPDYALVSRSVLATPIVKTVGSEMDIEYYLDV